MEAMGYERPDIEVIESSVEKMICASPGNEDFVIDNGEW